MSVSAAQGLNNICEPTTYMQKFFSAALRMLLHTHLLHTHLQRSEKEGPERCTLLIGSVVEVPEVCSKDTLMLFTAPSGDGPQRHIWPHYP